MNWKQYIKDCNRVGLESPTPYKVVPYKNGIGIKKIIFLDSGKKCCLPFDLPSNNRTHLREPMLSL